MLELELEYWKRLTSAHVRTARRFYSPSKFLFLNSRKRSKLKWEIKSKKLQSLYFEGANFFLKLRRCTWWTHLQCFESQNITLPCSQQPTNGAYSEPNKTVPHPRILFRLKNPFQCCYPISVYIFPNRCLKTDFPTNILCSLFTSPSLIIPACSSNLMVLYSIILIEFNKG